MRIPKVYGQSKASGCLFCGKQSIRMNTQGIPVCINHKEATLNDFKCACGRWLDLREGKWGPYWLCQDCGIVPMRKALEFNTIKDVSRHITDGRKQTPVGSRKTVAGGNQTTVQSNQTDADNDQMKNQKQNQTRTPNTKKNTSSNMLGYLPPDAFK